MKKDYYTVKKKDQILFQMNAALLICLSIKRICIDCIYWSNKCLV